VFSRPFRAYYRWIETPRVRGSDPDSWAQPWIILPAALAALLLCCAGVGCLLRGPLLVRLAGMALLLAGLVWAAVLIGYFLRPPKQD
jgi:hypothetical protein